MKNNNLSLLDTNQIVQKMFDSEKDAQRVSIVGGEKFELSIDSDKIANAVKEGLSNFKFMPENTAKLDIPTQIQSIEKNVFIPQIEIKTIEVPVIVKEIEYREIEKPVYIEKIVTIEKPIYIEKPVYVEKQVVVKELEFKEIIKERYYPLTIKIAAIFQAFCLFALLLTFLLKK